MSFDVIIRGGTVIDGSGVSGRTADVGTRAGRIAAVGDLKAARAQREIDAAGYIVAPGFVDPHTHVHNEAEGGIVEIPDADNYIRQGVTTVIAGNCGGSPWPIAAHLDRVRALEIRQNYCTLAGMSTLRGEAFSRCGRDPAVPAPAGPAEISAMQDLVRRAMDEGAQGLSTGYFGAHVTTDEIVEVARAAGERGGVYSSHIRNEGDALLGALEEIVEIGSRARMPVQVSHIKTYGRRNWWKAEAALEIIDRARARDIDIMADRYPYTASYTGIGALLPGWTRALVRSRGGMEAMADPGLRAEALAGVEDRLDLIGGPENAVLAPDPPDPSIEGRTLSEHAHERGLDPAEAALRLMERGGVSCIYFALCEENIGLHYRHPLVMTGSDGQLRRFGSGVSHPRNYGTFPRMIARYARDGGMRPEEAVRKCSTLAAERWGLRGRGVLAEGAWADIVVFSWTEIADHATFTDQHRYPTGIPWVLVNGGIAVDRGVTTDRGYGQVIGNDT